MHVAYIGAVMLLALVVPAVAQDLAISGSSTMAPLLRDIAQRYQDLHPGLRITVAGGGSASGLEDLQHGRVALAMVSRPLHATEAAALHVTAIAHDGTAVIVHARNPVRDLTKAEILAVFSAGFTDWAQLGGQGPITVVGRAVGSATLEHFCMYFQVEASALRPHVSSADHAQSIAMTASNTAAVAYVSVAAATTAISAGIPIRLLGLGGIAASPETVADRTFPLTRDLWLATRADPDGQTRAFLQYAASPAVRDLLAKHALAPPAER